LNKPELLGVPVFGKFRILAVEADKGVERFGVEVGIGLVGVEYRFTTLEAVADVDEVSERG